MKLRVKDNTLRFRLSQSEAKELNSKGTIHCTTSFGSSTFGYGLHKSINSFEVIFENGMITISIPSDIIENWAGSDQVGIDKEIQFENGDLIYILIEKDFKCLTERPDEDESDLYDNPHDKHTC